MLSQIKPQCFSPHARTAAVPSLTAGQIPPRATNLSDKQKEKAQRKGLSSQRRPQWKGNDTNLSDMPDIGISCTVQALQLILCNLAYKCWASPPVPALSAWRLVLTLRTDTTSTIAPPPPYNNLSQSSAAATRAKVTKTLAATNSKRLI